MVVSSDKFLIAEVGNGCEQCLYGIGGKRTRYVHKSTCGRFREPCKDPYQGPEEDVHAYSEPTHTTVATYRSKINIGEQRRER